MQITLEIPDEYLNKQSQNQAAAQIKLFAALLMFQTGQLSRGAACEYAGVDIYQFLRACKQHHISVVNTTSPELLANIAEKYGDPLPWQREQRKDRALAAMPLS